FGHHAAVDEPVAGGRGAGVSLRARWTARLRGRPEPAPREWAAEITSVPAHAMTAEVNVYWTSDRNGKRTTNSMSDRPPGPDNPVEGGVLRPRRHTRTTGRDGHADGHAQADLGGGGRDGGGSRGRSPQGLPPPGRRPLWRVRAGRPRPPHSVGGAGPPNAPGR